MRAWRSARSDEINWRITLNVSFKLPFESADPLRAVERVRVLYLLSFIFVLYNYICYYKKKYFTSLPEVPRGACVLMALNWSGKLVPPPPPGGGGGQIWLAPPGTQIHFFHHTFPSFCRVDFCIDFCIILDQLFRHLLGIIHICSICLHRISKNCWCGFPNNFGVFVFYSIPLFL